jgi:hypothetical protein
MAAVVAAAGMLALTAGVPALAADEASPDGPEAVRVYFTEEQALADVFAKADSLWQEPWTPTPGQRQAVEAELGWQLAEESFVFHRARRGDRDLGRAVILEEKGRFKPITFMVHVRPDGEVGRVLVMVYRESRGDGVRRQRFLKQFVGRDVDDPLRLNRDVVNVTGATLSSRAMAAGVRKALVLSTVRYGGRQ